MVEVREGVEQSLWQARCFHLERGTMYLHAVDLRLNCSSTALLAEAVQKTEFAEAGFWRLRPTAAFEGSSFARQTPSRKGANLLRGQDVSKTAETGAI